MVNILRRGLYENKPTTISPAGNDVVYNNFAYAAAYLTAVEEEQMPCLTATACDAACH